MLRSYRFTLQLASKLFIKPQFVRPFSQVNYKIHSQYQNDLHSCFDWNICRDLNDINHYFHKNYSKKVENEELPQITFDFKDVFLHEDQLRFLSKISELISTFDFENKNQSKLVLFVLENFNENMDHIFYTHRAMYSQKDLHSEIIKSILSIIKGIINPYKEGKLKKNYQKVLRSLLLNHHFIERIIGFEDFCQNYLQIVKGLDLLTEETFKSDFIPIMEFLGPEKTLKFYNILVKSEIEGLNKDTIIDLLHAYFLRNIAKIESYEALGKILNYFKSRKNQEGSIVPTQKISYQLKRLIESEKNPSMLFEKCDEIQKLLRALDLNWSEAYAIFNAYSAKCLTIKNFELIADDRIVGYIYFTKNILQKIPQAHNHSRNQMLHLIKNLLNILKQVNREELYFLLSIMSLSSQIKTTNAEVQQEIYNIIYEILSSSSFKKKLVILTEVDMMKYFYDLKYFSSCNLKEIYPEEKWHAINITDLPLKTQILAICYLDPLVKVPSDFYTFSEEKAEIIENNTFYFVKLVRHYEKLDKDFQASLNKFKSTKLRKTLSDYPLPRQIKFLKELVVFKSELFTNSKLKVSARDVFNNAFKELLQNPLFLNPEEIFFMIYKLGLFDDEQLLNNAREYLYQHSDKLGSSYLAQIFFYFSDSGKMTEKDSSFFQEYFTKNISKLGPQEFYPVSMAVRSMRLKPHFHHEFYEVLKIRSNLPEYAGIVCEHIYNELKTKQKKGKFIEEFLPRLKIALEKDPSYVSLYHLDRAMLYLFKFSQVDWLIPIYRKKLESYMKKPDLSYLPQVYSTVSLVLSNHYYDDQSLIPEIEKIIIENLNQFKPYEILKILTSLSHRYNYNPNLQLVHLLLNWTMKENFFTFKSKDNAYEGVSDSIDIGLLCMTFLHHSLILQDQSMKFIEKMLHLIKKVIEERTSTTSGSLILNPTGNIKHNLFDLHINQVLQGLLTLKYVKKLSTCQVLIDELIEKLKKIHPGTFVPEYLNKSYFQSEMKFYLKEKLFPGKEVIAEHPFLPYHVDFYVPEIKLAIECHGQHHYLYGGTQLRLTEIRKMQVLEAMGNKILIVPVNEWRNLNVEKREEYLRRKLEDIKINCV